mmetsp:Transcript_7763/g.48153  ORF Transcript_7763/g.48153 Transcript_7763/m.48153 type:complete len:210 (+) Transcript_7763:2680-3309(+)
MCAAAKRSHVPRDGRRRLVRVEVPRLLPSRSPTRGHRHGREHVSAVHHPLTKVWQHEPIPAMHPNDCSGVQWQRRLVDLNEAAGATHGGKCCGRRGMVPAGVDGRWRKWRDEIPPCQKWTQADSGIGVPATAADLPWRGAWNHLPHPRSPSSSNMAAWPRTSGSVRCTLPLHMSHARSGTSRHLHAQSNQPVRLRTCPAQTDPLQIDRR